MRTTIVLRAADPAQAAALLRAVGVPLQDPDRANPACWYVRDSVTFIVTAADGEPGISFVPEEAGAFAKAIPLLEAAIDDGTVTMASDQAKARVRSADLAFAVERDGPQMTSRNMDDVGKLFMVTPIFDKHGDAVAAALREAGATDPRLVGPSLAREPGSRRWNLVVDAPHTADLTHVEAVIRRCGKGFAEVRVRRSDEFSPDHLAEINRIAFDI